MSLLDSLFQLLGPQLEGVELRRAWGPGWGSRLVRGPVVSGEVLSARWAGQSQQTQVRLMVFAPEASQRREIAEDRKSTRLNSSHTSKSRMPSSA